MNKRFVAVLIGLVLIGAALTAVMASEQGRTMIQQLMGGRGEAQPPSSATTDAQQTAIDTAMLPSSTEVSHEPLFEGKLELLKENLLLFKYTEADQLNGIPNDFTYYRAGTYRTGEYAGYTRILALRPPEGPSDPEVFVLATKDFKTYVLDDPRGLTTKYALDDWQNPFAYLDQRKISKTAVLPSEFPQTLPLNETFSLFYRSIPSKYADMIQRDANGNQLSRVVIEQPEPTSKVLASPYNQLQILSTPYVQDMSYFDQLDADQQQDMKTRARFFAGSTVVTVVDSTGLPAVYALTTPGNIASYNLENQRFEQEYQVYLREMDRYEQDDSLPYPTYPRFVSPPSLGFSAKQIKLESGSQAAGLFEEYQTAIPGACATSQDTRTFMLKDEELKRVGSAGSIELFTLKDDNHALYRLAYDNKMSYFKEFPEEWAMVNEGTPRYSFEEYVARHPLFFFKNYWQEWVGVGEFDVNLPGGCGKPVIYLYPTEPTTISVRLDMPIQFTTDIPPYQNGWQVVAQPNGTLADLSVNRGACDQYDEPHFGAEYAKQACLRNQYPYLYWAGSVRAEAMPRPVGGWIVAEAQLAEFLTQKLTMMGLNETEQRDFLSYWVPMLRQHQAPFYQIGFLQTRELGMLFPMSVTPRPDSIFRIFMDYTPLQSMPTTVPTPQNLDRVERHGFTLIEWGGMKK